MSDSSVLVKPSIADPSKIHLLSSAFFNWLFVIATFLRLPDRSVN